MDVTFLYSWRIMQKQNNLKTLLSSLKVYAKDFDSGQLKLATHLPGWGCWIKISSASQPENDGQSLAIIQSKLVKF